MAEEPAQPQPTAIAGVPAAQAGPLATIIAIVLATVMQQYQANSNHTTTTDDIGQVKSAQTELANKFSALSDQLSQLKTMQSTEAQLDNRITTAEQAILSNSSDIKRQDRRMSLMHFPNPSPAPTAPTIRSEPLQQQTPERRTR